MKHLIVILIAIALYQNFIISQEKSIKNINQKVDIMNQKILNEQAISDNEKKILQYIKISMETNKAYSALFYSSKEKESVVFTLFQKDIEAAIKDAKIELITSNWKEAVTDDSGLKKIAIFLKIKSTSKGFASFYKILSKKKKVVVFDDLHVNKLTRDKEYITTTFTLITYQNTLDFL